jgi:shikimate kinase
VLSLGGGAVLSPETRALLRDHRVVLLDGRPRHATSRVGLNRDRPVLALNPRAVLKVLLEQRMPLYREVATEVVDTNGRSVRAVADELLALLAVPQPGAARA